MIKKIINSIEINKKKRQDAVNKKARKDLEKKVIKGTDLAIREYRDVFKKLAEYDRT